MVASRKATQQRGCTRFYVYKYKIGVSCVQIQNHKSRQLTNPELPEGTDRAESNFGATGSGSDLMTTTYSEQLARIMRQRLTRDQLIDNCLTLAAEADKWMAVAGEWRAVAKSNSELI